MNHGWKAISAPLAGVHQVSSHLLKRNICVFVLRVLRPPECSRSIGIGVRLGQVWWSKLCTRGIGRRGISCISTAPDDAKLESPAQPDDAAGLETPKRRKTMRFRCVVQYDGTDFNGFQVQGSELSKISETKRSAAKAENVALKQSLRNEPSTLPHHRTVQGVLERAIFQLSGQAKSIDSTDFRCTVECAGRTDAGTHASGQVVAFDVAWPHDPQKLNKAMNCLLPRGVTVSNVQEADPRFRPRFGASFRRYEYTIYNAPHRSALHERYAWHVPEPLDEMAMLEGIRHLQGSHDFSSYGRPPDGSGHCIREVLEVDVKRTSPHMIVINIKGRAFLFRMVRNIVGTLRYVGKGAIPPDEVKVILKGKKRSLCRKPAPACGLVLAEVGFWGENGEISYEEWAKGKKHEQSFSPRLWYNANGNPIGAHPDEMCDE